jgi:hypothetical protein
MLILPDTRDVIELVEHRRPISTQEFEQYLRARNNQIVLSFTNVRELAGPLATGAEFMQLRPLSERSPDCRQLSDISARSCKPASLAESHQSQCGPFTNYTGSDIYKLVILVIPVILVRLPLCFPIRTD